ncbi:hypothetical protein RJO27_003696 [Enterobacter hormaechei]|nr:hypothetical protein [Enterobacter hormaechei]
MESDSATTETPAETLTSGLSYPAHRSEIVLVLRKGDIEIPFDLSGVLYIELDEYPGWIRKLLSELAYAGVPFDKEKR